MAKFILLCLTITIWIILLWYKNINQQLNNFLILLSVLLTMKTYHIYFHENKTENFAIDNEAVGNFASMVKSGNVIVSNLKVTGNLDVTSDAKIGGKLQANGDVNVTGAITAGGKLQANNDINVTGKIQANNDVTISGKLQVNSDANITGLVKVGKDLNTVGSIFADGNIGTENVKIFGDKNATDKMQIFRNGDSKTPYFYFNKAGSFGHYEAGPAFTGTTFAINANNACRTDRAQYDGAIWIHKTCGSDWGV